MTAIDDARAALDTWYRQEEPTYPELSRNGHVLADALRALIAEHERLTAETERFPFPCKQYKGIRHNGYSATRCCYTVAEAAPPTDDEREALDRLLRVLLTTEDEDPENGEPGWSLVAMRNQILAAGFRRQGPITDEWEYRSTYSQMTFPTFESARHWYEDGPILRRRKAGPWEPVEAAREVKE